MKYINKGNEPSFLTQWKSQATQNGMTIDYKTFKQDKNLKNQLHSVLIQEQGAICCYCEDKINISNSHIEHFEPQSTGNNTLDYNNLLSSCLKNLPPQYLKHCGHGKENWYEPTLLISPLDPGCETKFSYSFQGDIRPSNVNDKAAATTIAKLQLNCPNIQTKRKSALKPFLSSTLTQDEITIFVNAYLAKNADGSYNRFYTMIKYLFSKYLSPP